MDQERDTTWKAEDERPVVEDGDTDDAVPDVELPLEANPADAIEQAIPVAADDEDD